MVTDVSITVQPEEEKDESRIGDKVLLALAEKGIRAAKGEVKRVFVKKSIDARRGRVRLVLRYRVYIGEAPDESDGALPVWKQTDGRHTVAIVGAGPAGLFGALRLLEDGIKPVIIERGACTQQRKRDIAAISTRGVVDSNSNYCFGEGGAGTFSDGKLYTRSNKRGDIGKILRIFTAFGASPAILTDAHPHIGTDRLPGIINAMRARIVELGGEFRFDSQCVGFETTAGDGAAVLMTASASVAVHASAAASDTPPQAQQCPAERTAAGDSVAPLTAADASGTLPQAQQCAVERTSSPAGIPPLSSAPAPRVTGVRVRHTKTGAESVIYADAVVLATGHSATDIYELIARIAPAALEEKTFAVGVRVEHPRALIDAIQFHGKPMAQAAEYRLTAQVDGRGVYSFCMCPGGFVVPSSTAPAQIVINGMSAASRNSRWSNSAIVVETRAEDIPAPFREQAERDGVPALAGLYWRSWLEAETARHGNGQQAPAQRLTDFLARRASKDLPRTSYTPGVVASRLDEWLPTQISARLAAAFRDYDRAMHGFVSEDALVIASETRTSTPVRILRDKATLECTALRALYPAGEGSGYSGGIVSSAMDGEKACAAISAALRA